MRLRLLTLVALAAALLAATPTLAQTPPEEFASQGFLTPFPDGDIYKLTVIGDDFAEGLLPALQEALTDERQVQGQRKRLALSGIASNEFDDQIKVLEDPTNKDPITIAVVMLGTQDRAPVRNSSGKRVLVGSDEWREIYGRRVDRVFKALKRKRAAVYWVGLPIMRKADWTNDLQSINEIIRERATINGMKFIDAWDGFVDENGAYAARGPDLSGRIQLLRDSDGIEFTEAGNKKLAHFVEREIRRDLAQAKSERNVPLAGADAEQKRLAPLRPKPQVTSVEAPTAKTDPFVSPGTPQPVVKDTKNPNYVPALVQPSTAAAGALLGGQKLDNSKISLRVADARGQEQTVSVDILRPEISASVMALVTRRGSGDKAATVGETLPLDQGNGMILMDTVSMLSEFDGTGRRLKVAPTQTPFFRVLVKGERLAPKPGRADDFTWPRNDEAAPLPPLPAVALAPAAAVAPAPAVAPLAPATAEPDRSSAPRRPVKGPKG